VSLFRPNNPLPEEELLLLSEEEEEEEFRLRPNMDLERVLEDGLELSLLVLRAGAGSLLRLAKRGMVEDSTVALCRCGDGVIEKARR